MPRWTSKLRHRSAGLQKLAGLLWLLAAGVIGGCASHLEYDSLVAADSNIPRQVELANTPFHAQTAHHCGPASLATLLNAAGIGVSPDELAHLTYLPGREGSLGVELLATPRHYALMGYEVDQSLEALLAEVSQGRPVMVLQNLGLSWLPRWHFAVLIGYDLDKGEAILRSGTTERMTMPLDTFERTWLRGDRWAMLVLEADEVPAKAREVNYLRAILGLEKLGHAQAANQAYQQALQLWPASVNVWMGWGNNRYAAGDSTAAEQAYRQALSLNDTFAPAYNNLAQVLLDQGQWQEAEQLARRALEHSDSYKAIYQQTLREIQEARKH